jgi:predicted ATP-grasp superfamily ATP-dependent carboligase
MWADERPFLLVSASGRALAAMARRAGVRSVVLDLFADQDTAACCDAVRCVRSDRQLRFHAGRLLEGAAALAPRDASAGLVFGSGLEGRVGLLARLARGRRLFGNVPETVARLKRPETLLPLLDALAIRTPDTSVEAPPDPRGWLVKHAGGAGGFHVRGADSKSARKPGRYFQRFIAGRSLSTLFLADGHQARLIGFSEQWTAGEDCPRTPFSFGGAISDASVPAAARVEVEGWVARLTESAGLVGLNGIDFILDQAERPHFLEVNPRPTASAELHDDRAAGGLFRWHLDACVGRLPAKPLERCAVRGQRVVYAPTGLRVPATVRWPDWVGDRPAPGVFFGAGAPVCTVHAAGVSVQHVRRQLDERSRTIRRSVMPLAA